jgi:hypothetical protein
VEALPTVNASSIGAASTARLVGSALTSATLGVASLFPGVGTIVNAVALAKDGIDALAERETKRSEETL